MGETEALKLFVSERLQAAASEIFSAFEAAAASYEERISRLQEENERHRSLLSVILKPTLPKTKGLPAQDFQTTAVPDHVAAATEVLGQDWANEGTALSPSIGLQTVFITCDDFVTFAANGRCAYCINETPATIDHLMKRHYHLAVHFTQDGAAKFVIPCMCKDKIQNRSHWHCPHCKKIIHRRCNFEAHLTKQHNYTILQQRPDAGKNKGKPTHQKGHNQFGEQSLKRELHSDLDICLDSPIKEIRTFVTLKNISTQVPLSGVHAATSTGSPVCIKTEGTETSQTSLHDLQPQSGGGRGTRPENSNVTSPSPSCKEPYCCKACGENFHFLYALKTHVHTHVRDKNCVCGICGRLQVNGQRLASHLQCHNKRSKCDMCKKRFSSTYRLKLHRRFHRPNTPS